MVRRTKCFLSRGFLQLIPQVEQDGLLLDRPGDGNIFTNFFKIDELDVIKQKKDRVTVKDCDFKNMYYFL